MWMDDYIDFEVQKIKTFSLQTSEETKKVLKINDYNTNFKIIHSNIWRIACNFDEFQIFIEGLETQIECIVLTETHFIPDLSLYNIDGYWTVYNYGKFNQRDGVIVFIKSELYESHNLFDFSGSSLIKIKANFENKTFIINAFYRSPASENKVDSFVEELHDILDIQTENSDFKLFLGDINIDLLTENDNKRNYLDVLNECGYQLAINVPTRVQRNSKTCIDHIFVYSKSVNFYDNLIPLIINTSVTDHYTVML